MKIELSLYLVEVENEIKREHCKKPKHETLVRIRTFENAIKELMERDRFR